MDESQCKALDKGEVAASTFGRGVSDAVQKVFALA
jgi:hypothetical protein